MDHYRFPDRESKLLEFKSTVPKFDTLIKTCIAFANAAGGQIVIGVDDNREVIGITEEDRSKIYNDFPNSLYDSTVPSIVAQIYEKNFGKHSVLIIEVPMSPRKPYYLKSKGMAEGTYIRVGSSTRKANQEYVDDLAREARRLFFDEELANAPMQALSNELLISYYESKVTNKRLLADKIISQKHANKEHFSPTIAGLLLFSERPNEYIPEALIKCTQFTGIEGRNIIQTEDITGTIEQQATKSLKLLESWLASNYKLSGVKLEGKMIIPKVAIREAIMNALLHRKYEIPGAIKIAKYEDRLEIFSPGCFPGLVDINNLGDGTTYLRNPTLARIAYQMHMIETRGTGIRLMLESCKKAGMKSPIFHEEGDFVKVVFYFEPDRNAQSTESESILKFIQMRGQVNAQDVARFLSVSHNTAIRKLNELIKIKKVLKRGKASSTHYVVIN